jgi:hypothetical protein
LGSWPKQGVARLQAKRETWESHHILPGMQRVWRMNLHTPKWTPMLGVRIPSKRNCRGQNPFPWGFFYIIWKPIEVKMSKMSSHCPFEHLKHKLWPKERPRVKLTIWLLTTKIQERTQFPYVQETCDIPLKSSQQELQLCFKPHCNWRSACEVMRKLQESQVWEFLDLGVPRQKAICMWPPWRVVEYNIRGKVLASPKSRSWCVLWVRIAHGLS